MNHHGISIKQMGDWSTWQYSSSDNSQIKLLAKFQISAHRVMNINYLANIQVMTILDFGQHLCVSQL